MSVYKNPDVLSVNPDTKCIPSFCTESIEMFYYVAEAAEEEYNKMFMEMGISELHAFEESGSVVLYEGSKFKSFIDTIVNWFKGLWGKIKAQFQKILQFFEDKRKENVEKMKKKLGKSEVEKIPDDKFPKIKSFENPFSKSAGAKDGYYGDDAVKKYKDNAIDLCTKVKDEFTSASDKSEALKDYDNSKLISEILGVESDRLSEAIKKIKETYLKDVDVTKDWASKNWDDIVGIALQGKIKDKIKKTYQSEKEEIDQMISAVKDLGKDETEQVDGIRKCVSIMKDIASISNAGFSAINSSYVTIFNSYSRVLKKLYIVAINAEVIKESTANYVDTYRPNSATKSNPDIPDSYATESAYVDSLFDF